jgi:UDP-glucose 4-epimerase
VTAPGTAGPVLVTGSAGHLGEALVLALRDAGVAVRGVDIVPSAGTDVVGSIADRAVVDEAMRGVRAVLHAATLHKPHVATHAQQAFVDTNVTGTLHLLEAAVAARVEAFVFTSTTSTFGDALVPPPGAPAAWIDEAVTPVPKNIYGVTKTAAEDLCRLAHRNHRLPVLVLRTSRFFPEADDEPAQRAAWADDNLKTNEFLHRRVDIEDVVSAHLLALAQAPRLGFGRFVVSATTPFVPADAPALRQDAAAVIRQRVPLADAAYARLGWRLPQTLDRIYDNALARRVLGWAPRHDFASLLARVAAGGSWRSALALRIGAKGYHPT